MRGLCSSAKCLLTIFAIVFTFSPSFAQNKGPGGVGVSDGTGTLHGWWRGEAGLTLNGIKVATWADQSGYGNSLSQATDANRPTSNTSAALNSQSIIRYTAANSTYFSSAFSGPNVDNITLFVVANGSSYQSLFRWQNSAGTFVVYPWEQGGGRVFISSSDGGTGTGVNTGLVNGVNNVGAARYKRNTANGMQAYLNGGVNAQRTSVNSALPSQPFFSGVYNPGPGEYPTADVGEMIYFNTALNDAQMIIIQNYLAAKFNVTLSSNDVYTMDNGGNGNYDFDVAGIGRVDASNIHSDAQGTGLIRVQNPTGLGNNEYFMWGHNNLATTSTNTTDVPGGVYSRFLRTWRVTETGEVGNVDIDIDVTTLTDFNALASSTVTGRLTLIVDTDNDNTFNDETPITGATHVTGNIYRFSGVSVINTSMRFTFAVSPITYYSLGSGAWEDNTKWSLSADGSTGPLPAGAFPTRIDNVVINTGHTITVNNVADNGSAGVKPDDLAQSNIGPFGSSNLSMFYQIGNIFIRGTLNISGIEAMIGGYTWVETGGSLTAGSNLVVTGNLQADTGSTLSTLDDLVLTGFSTTIINTASTSSDDLIIDHTDATLCGTGTSTLQNGAGSSITFANSGTINQVCSTFVIKCTGTGCAGTFPTAGGTIVITGSTGPGGVGSNAGDSQLILWFRVDNGINLTGSNIDSWTNSAGVAALDVSETLTQRPTLVASALNGFSEVSFGGSNRLRTGLTLTTSNFINDQASSFVVNRAGNTTQTSIVYGTDPLDGNRFSTHIPWGGTVYFDIGQCCGNDARLDLAGLTGLTSYSIWSYEALSSTGKTFYRNGTSQLSRALTSTFINHANYRFNLGGNTSGADGFVGGMTEVIIFNNKINLAERMIIENYLSAKYAVILSANDVYTQDNSGNGNFDFDVAGIGRASDGSYHRDSQGTGVVRIWNPQDLDNSEFLMFGHNGATLTTTTNTAGTVDGTIIKERLTRIWRVSESGGDVGSFLLSFDTDQFSGNFVGSNLRLLIDRDGDGFQDNDVAPVSGSFSNNKIIFTNVTFQSGDRFTLGNTSATQALPITLVSFDAAPRENDVLVTWQTASEVNNDHFEIHRSADAEHWETITTKPGAGTTKQQINYEILDTRPLNGKSYYRLKQVDYDGNSSHSPIVSVDFTGHIKVWPNPSAGVFNISSSDVYVEVWNTQGKKILSSMMDGSKTGIDISEQPAGVYVLKIYNSEGVSVHRLVKK
ncbi:MAG: T9SS type A sorting domain-containing protein [Bacteroidota bacterium]